VTTSVVVAAHVASLLESRRRTLAAARVHRPRYRGSVPGLLASRPRNFELGLQCILRDYFGLDGLPPVFGPVQFERRFRVPMPVFLRIYQAIKSRPFWAQRVNATGQPQAHPLHKLVAVFRVLAYGESYDRADEYVRLSQSTIARAVKLFSEFVVDEFTPCSGSRHHHVGSSSCRSVLLISSVCRRNCPGSRPTAQPFPNGRRGSPEKPRGESYPTAQLISSNGDGDSVPAVNKPLPNPNAGGQSSRPKCAKQINLSKAKSSNK